MMEKRKKIIILNGIIITPFQFLENKAILIEKGKIKKICKKEKVGSLEETDIIDAKGGFIAPGFIDIHVHGGGGADIMDGEYEAVKKVASTQSHFGTTAFLPTTMTMSKSKIMKSLKSVNEAFKKGTGSAEILGINLEGPYINPEKKGAQSEKYIRKASNNEFLKFKQVSGNLIRLVDLAPELPGSINFISWLHQQGIIVSVGHSNATFEQMQESIGVGLTHVTHIFNAMSGINHREPGVAGAALTSSRLTVELIADGIHVHPAVMKILTKTKDIGKIILITDGIRAVNMPDGTYDLGGHEVTVFKDQARLKDGTLAGSILTLDKAVRNMISKVGISLIEAIQMVTINPSRFLGVEEKKGSLEQGKDADIVILDKELEVEITIVQGSIVYNKSDNI